MSLPLLVDALACYRIVRLVTRDELTRPLREKYLEPLLVQPSRPDPTYAESYPEPRTDLVGRAAYLASCGWCLSIWTAAGVAVLRRTSPARWEPLAEVLAVAALAGMALDRDRG